VSARLNAATAAVRAAWVDHASHDDYNAGGRSICGSPLPRLTPSR
jgi:hypothetical protein